MKPQHIKKASLLKLIVERQEFIEWLARSNRVSSELVVKYMPQIIDSAYGLRNVMEEYMAVVFIYNEAHRRFTLERDAYLGTDDQNEYEPKSKPYSGGVYDSYIL